MRTNHSPSATSNTPEDSRDESKDVLTNWPMAWALGWTEMLSWGILYYAFTVLLVPMQDEFGWSSGTLTGAYSLALLTSGLCAPMVGRWIDHRGARALMTAGSLLATSLLVAWSRVDSVWAYYLIWIGIGVTLACTLYEPAFAAIAPWFKQHRTRALLIITFFGGLASTVFLPLTGWLEQEFGWRDAVLYLAALLAAGTVIPHALVLRSPPDVTQRPRTHLRADIGRYLQSSWFRKVSLGFFIQAFTTGGIIVHMIAYLVDRGVSATTAAWLAGMIGAVQTGTRVLLTLVDGRMRVETLTAIMFGAQTIATLILVFWPDSLALWGAVFLFGMGRGALTLLRPALLLSHYDVKEFGSVSGTLAAILMLAGASAPFITGVAVGVIDRYEPIFLVFAVLSMASAAVLWAVRVEAADALPHHGD